MHSKREKPFISKYRKLFNCVHTHSFWRVVYMFITRNRNVYIKRMEFLNYILPFLCSFFGNCCVCLGRIRKDLSDFKYTLQTRMFSFTRVRKCSTSIFVYFFSSPRTRSWTKIRGKKNQKKNIVNNLIRFRLCTDQLIPSFLRKLSRMQTLKMKHLKINRGKKIERN